MAAITIEIAREWLTEIEGFDDLESELGPTVDKLVQDLRIVCKKNEHRLAWSLVARIPQVCDGYGVPLEMAEARVACACAVYHMGKFPEAARLFQEAIEKYPPSQHHRGVVWWMLGHVYWRIPGRENDAIQAWRKSRSIFRSLPREDRFMSKAQRDWYERQLEVMGADLIVEMQKRGLCNECDEVLDEEPSAPADPPRTQLIHRSAAPKHPKPESNGWRKLKRGFIVGWPIIGEIPAGTPVDVGLTADDLSEMHFINIADRQHAVYDIRPTMGGQITLSFEEKYYLLKVTGDSMNQSDILAGDYVLMRRASVAEEDNIVAVVIEKGEEGADEPATLKYFRRTTDRIVFEPDSNQEYPSIEFGHMDDGYKIHGVAVAVLKPFPPPGQEDSG